jgi:hypothetical protein
LPGSGSSPRPGFTHVALVQISADNQERFISWAATDLLPGLRGLASGAHARRSLLASDARTNPR